MADESWDADHPVLALLRRRREAGSSPGNRTDKAKLGLAVEGGGMRGVVSASMLTALEDLGYSDAIDAVYACSSGAINSAYYLVGKTWYPLTIYFDDLTTLDFVNLRRAFTSKPILNIDYAFDEILANVKPLDYDDVIKSPIPLHIAITLVDEMRTMITDSLGSADELREALRASSWLPVALKGTTTFRGQRAIDGGVLTALPFRLAMAADCTHILSLSTHPMGYVSHSTSLINRYTKRHLEKLKPGLGDSYAAALRTKQKDMEQLAAMRRSDSYTEPFIFDIAPLPGSPDVKRHELAVGKLLESARGAYEVMYAALEGHPSSAVRSGLIRAIPRFGIAEKDFTDKRLIHLVDYPTRDKTPWGIARFAKRE
jgi:predicted patatin/cPLA2 family phospholipase